MTAYRCTWCGSRTRCDVESTTTTKAFHHLSLAGEPRVEKEAVLERRVGAVTRRLCGHGAVAEWVERRDRPASA